MFKKMKRSIVGLVMGGSLLSVSAGLGVSGCAGGIIDQLAQEVCAEAPQLCQDGSINLDGLNQSSDEESDQWSEEDSIDSYYSDPYDMGF